MSSLEAFILGIIQGLTEFLPISSSGHLVIFETLFKLNPSEWIIFDLTLHLGSLGAVLLYFRKDLIGFIKNRRLLGCLFLATLSTASLAIPLKKVIIFFFEDLTYVAVFLVFNGIVLLTTRLLKQSNIVEWKDFKIGHAIIIGLIQILGILPGISRSGITIAGAMFLGIHSRTAAVFSFLLSIFAIVGGFFIEILSVEESYRHVFSWSYLIAFLSSFFVGYFAIKIVFRLIEQKRFFYFGIYCIILGALVLFI